MRRYVYQIICDSCDETVTQPDNHNWFKEYGLLGWESIGDKDYCPSCKVAARLAHDGTPKIKIKGA